VGKQRGQQPHRAGRVHGWRGGPSGAGGWHDIEGWQGTLDEGDQKKWWLAPNLFGKGPFRWLVYQSTERDELLATSESFYLPDFAGKKVWVEVSLSE
jgi:hypothetical protein